MQRYLMEGSYAPHALAALIKNPQDRTEHVRKTIEQMGGKLDGVWTSLGEHDVYSIFELPDHVAASALHAVLASTGALKYVNFTEIFDPPDGLKALHLAAGSIYKPPSE